MEHYQGSIYARSTGAKQFEASVGVWNSWESKYTQLQLFDALLPHHNSGISLFPE
jgi:hypothetical protein